MQIFRCSRTELRLVCNPVATIPELTLSNVNNGTVVTQESAETERYISEVALLLEHAWHCFGVCVGKSFTDKTLPARLSGKDQCGCESCDNQFVKPTHNVVPNRRGNSEDWQCAGLDTHKHITL